MTDFNEPPAWVADAVFYQIFPDRFASSERVIKPGSLEPWDAPPTSHGFKGGDLLGIVDRLDYLAELGINALYLNPVFASASNHRYYTFDYFQVDPLLGGDAALRELLDAAHARGMRVVLDGVFNHSGRGFWPFHHVVENGASSPYVDWFHVDREALVAGRSLRPYPSAEESLRVDEDAAAAERQRQGDITLRHLGYRAWWDLPPLPKLNTDNPHMREYLLGAAEHWLRFGIDGWRLDVAEEIDAGFWREFRQRVRAVNPQAYIVAEIWRAEPGWTSGDTFDALMNYPLTEALLSFTAARHLDMEVLATQHEYREFVQPIDGLAFATRLESHLATYRPSTNRAQLNLLDSHDTARFLTIAGDDVNSLRLAVLATMTLPGAPCVYYGDEIGLRGRQDPDSRRAFPWDSASWDRELLDFYRAAIALRHASPVLRQGEYRTLAATGDALAYERRFDGQRAIVVLNAGDERASLAVRTADLPGPLRPITLPGMSKPTFTDIDGETTTIELDRRSAAVLMGGVTQ